MARRQVQQYLDSLRASFQNANRNSSSLYRITKESYGFDRRARLLLCLTTSFSFLRFLETFLDARLISYCLMGYESRQDFQLHVFTKLILAKLILVASRYVLSIWKINVSNIVENVFVAKREGVLIDAYLRLNYLEQTRKGLRSKFMSTKEKIGESGRYFTDIIGILCMSVETLFIFSIAILRLCRLSFVAAFCLLLLFVLCNAHQLLLLGRTRDKNVDSYRSVPERISSTLGYFPFTGDEYIQDLVLNRADAWLLNMHRKALEHVKPRDLDSNTDGIFYLLQLLEIICIPCLTFLLGIPLDVSVYNLAQRSLNAVSSNVWDVSSTLQELRWKILPFAEDYLECIYLGRERLDHEDIVLSPITRIELKSLFFGYSQNTTEQAVALPAKAETDLSPSESDESKLDSFKDSGWALKDFNFVFETGKVYSIVGKNGSGKSTLVGLLTRLYKPSKGQILVNNQDISAISRCTWLNQVAAVPQEHSLLWNFTIRDNIAFGYEKNNIVEDEAIACEITEYVDLDTYYGDPSQSNAIEGTEKQTWVDDLSGGQCQSIALARGFCRAHTATLFILDEPSSSLDPEREFKLFSRLRKEKKGRITIFVSHSLKTCRASDCILVLSEGELVQTGSHQELLGDDEGVYAKLYNLQDRILL